MDVSTAKKKIYPFLDLAARDCELSLSRKCELGRYTKSEQRNFVQINKRLELVLSICDAE